MTLATIILRIYMFLLLTVRNPSSVGHHLCHLSDGLAPHGGIMLRMYILLLLTVESTLQCGASPLLRF